MRIDFKKLEKLERSYRFENPVCTNTLQTLVDIVLGYGETPNYVLAPANVQTASQTLIDLGILTLEPSKKDPQQLNS
jgi:hypothetical protein